MAMPTLRDKSSLGIEANGLRVTISRRMSSAVGCKSGGGEARIACHGDHRGVIERSEASKIEDKLLADEELRWRSVYFEGHRVLPTFGPEEEEVWLKMLS